MSSDSDTSEHSIEYSNSDDESFNFARAARIRKPRILKSDSEEDISDVEEDDLITSDSEDDIKVSDESLNKSKSRTETQSKRGSNDSGKDQSIEDANLENDVVSSDSESNEILKKTTLNHDTTNKNDSSDLNNISIHSLGNRKSLFSSSRVVPDIINSSSSENEETIDIIDDSDDVILRDSAENDQNQIIITDSETESSKTSQQSLDVESHLDVNEQSQQSVNQENNDVINVTSVEYFEQREKIRKLEMDLIQVKKALVMTKSSTLIDNGASIRQHKAKLESSLEKERKLLERMVVSQVSNLTPDRLKPKVPLWDDIRAGTSSVVPNTFGKQAMLTYNTQKALTLDLLEQMHQSLETCPKENTFAEDPKGLKVELMNHQRRGLAWLLWREKQKPSGGILADDMGLGKTLTMISLVLKTRELERMSKKYMDEDSRSSDDENSNPNGKKKKNVQKGGTLVVCPASLINQWSGEIDNRVKRGLISYEVFHGTKRETKASRLAQYDMVITTYGIASQKDIIDRIKWRRIILDEAHTIRNHRTLSSISICELSAKTRWAVTGTPVHNKEMDMYSLLKFLRCAPFDDLGVWKRWVGAKSSGGPQRLHTVTSSLMLRRTKEELKLKGALDCVPQRQWQIIDVQLEEPEMAVYQKMLLFSRNLFAQYLHQKAEKNTDLAQDLENLPPNSEYMKMRDKLLKMNKMQDVSASHILVLLLRLRQICCHPTLISSGISDDMDVEDDSFQEVNLMEQLNNLHLDDDDDTDKFAENRNEFEPQANLPLNEASKNVFNKSNPVFSSNYKSSKIAKMLEVLRDKILPSNDKTIIVSQWPSYLRITAEFLKQESIEFSQLDGTVPVPKRMAMVNDFNNPNHKVKVLLLSLTAGGVGLNLIGANHLILMDLHWNPQLENQAQDRIYRVGQKKTVYVYKFLVNETIEERILKLQDNKKNLAQEIITGSKQVMSSKLTLNDMRTLFNM